MIDERVVEYSIDHSGSNVTEQERESCRLVQVGDVSKKTRLLSTMWLKPALIGRHIFPEKVELLRGRLRLVRRYGRIRAIVVRAEYTLASAAVRRVAPVAIGQFLGQRRGAHGRARASGDGLLHNADRHGGGRGGRRGLGQRRAPGGRRCAALRGLVVGHKGAVGGIA